MRQALIALRQYLMVSCNYIVTKSGIGDIIEATGIR